MKELDSRLYIPREKGTPGPTSRGEDSDYSRVVGLVAAAMFIALVLLGPIMTVRQAGEADSFGGLRQFGYLLALGLAGYSLRSKRLGWKSFVIPIPIMILMGWCWISVIWAIDTDASVRRVFLTSTVILTVFWLVRAVDYERLLTTIRIALAILLVVNFLTVLFDPSTGIQINADVGSTGVFWRGIMSHKNFAGPTCALTIILFLFDATKIDWRIRAATIFGSAIFLINSISKTSMGMLGAGIIAAYILKKFAGRRRVFLIVGLIFLIFCFYVATTASPELVTQFINDPKKFTGRGLIWLALVRYSADHPMLGAGFESFWNINAESPIYQYGMGFTQLVTEGHMGYLDLLVTLGYPGLILVVIAMVAWPLARLFATATAVIEQAGLVCAILVFAIGQNFTESTMLERDNIVGVFMLVAIAILYTLPIGMSARSSNSKDAARDVLRTMQKRRRRTIPV